MSTYKPNTYNKKFDNKKPYADRTPKPRIPGTSVEVRNGDVGGALRRLKKILENDDRQKELAKREYYEKPSAKRKRIKDQSIRRHKKELLKKHATGAEPIQETGGLKHLKGKRSRRKHAMLKEMFSRAMRRR
jgi:small subunit ribosomal protein S21|tara:strand:- start:3139 stop:3534 length:396 start_codon:yes stop_codon:yes gene_type:complete